MVLTFGLQGRPIVRWGLTDEKKRDLSKKTQIFSTTCTQNLPIAEGSQKDPFLGSAKIIFLMAK
ncbi:MAG: hypothetical protein ACFFDI_04210 [Promethearchaeota archaeon]